MTRKNNQISTFDKLILTIIKLIIIFAICIVIQNKIIRITGYQIFVLEDPGEEKYIQHTYIKKGHKIYVIQYEEDYDIASWEKDMKYWGYIVEHKD